MIVGIPEEAWAISPNNGDELVVYDSEGLIVGNAPYSEDISVITIWGNDELTIKKDGLNNGERFNLELWKADGRTIHQLLISDWRQGLGQYEVNAISLAGSVILKDVEEKILIKVVDALGREIDKENKDALLLYIYDDGSVEKKYIVE